LGELSSLLLVVFAVDAVISVWRKGKAENRFRAAVVCGSIAFFILFTAGLSALINRQIIELPYWVSFPFAAILVAMAFELGAELVEAAEVTERLRLSEASLHESEKRFRLVADAAPVPIWMSGVDKLCTFFNKPWLDFTGRAMEQELGNGWAEGVHPDDLQSCLKTYTEAFDARKPFVMQYRLRRRDGQYCWIKDDGVPRYNAEGNFAGYIGSCVDVTELISKEQALRENEARMTMALDAARVGLYDWNFAKDELWGTKARLAQLGLPDSRKVTLEEGLSRVHVADRDRLRQVLMDAARTRKDYQCEYQIMFADGSEHWTELRGRHVIGTDGEPVLRMVAIDVTEQKQAEQNFRLAVEASPSGILLVDPQGRIVLVNTHIEELFGYKRDELIGKRVDILVSERLRNRHPAHRAQFFDAPETRAMGAGRDLFAQRKDGSEFPVEIGLNPIQTPQGLLVLANVVDITERKEAEEKFRLAVEASPSGIVLVNRDGHITLVNTQTERMFGYDRNELIGKPVEILIPERFASGHSGYRAKFLGAPEARAMGAGRELFARRKDGSEFPVEIGLNPIQMAGGLLILANVVDISARLATEAQTRHNREQVELLSRVSLLGEMTASLAHELNQPLAAIMNNASAAMEYIEQGRLSTKQLREILTDVTADGRRAFNIVRDVRNAIKKGTPIRGQINLNDVVKSVAHMLQPDAVANVCKMEMSLSPDLAAIEGEPTQIQQVLINLVSNAFDAMGETPASRRIVRITTNSNGDGTISVAVRDHGRGIAEAARERLFEHFYTTKKKGLGMGLAIVRSIVEAHGGTITAENADGGGARFHFRLPAKKEIPL
jgi:PAS domain S-box-containing protein